MTCDDASRRFVGFCFATLDDDERAALEAHLLECRACLAEYLAVKRALDLAEDVPAPRPEVRLRLRRAVAEELGVAPLAVARARWERPAAIAFAAVALLAATGTMRWLTSGPGAPPYALAALHDDAPRR
jgi:anti-sigma factor RsiW